MSFVGVHHPDLGLGFDVWVGGLPTNFMLGQWLGVFATLEEVSEIWAGAVSVFRDYGHRRLRNRARLKFLVTDWGVVRFCEALEREYLQRTLTDRPAPPRRRVLATTSVPTPSGTVASTSVPPPRQGTLLMVTILSPRWACCGYADASVSPSSPSSRSSGAGSLFVPAGQWRENSRS